MSSAVNVVVQAESGEDTDSVFSPLSRPAHPVSVPQKASLPDKAILGPPDLTHQPLAHIAIGMITGAWTLHLHNVLSLMQARDLGADLLIKPAGPYLDIERNAVVQMFRDRNDEYEKGGVIVPREWFVFIDSDIQFDPMDLLKLCNDPINAPIVCGVYHNHFPNGRSPVVYRWDDERSMFDHYTCIELGCCPESPCKWDTRGNETFPLPREESGLIAVDAFGAGLLAVHRSVIEAFAERFAIQTADGRTSTAQAFFVEQTLQNGAWYGEDYLFAMRAKKVLGYPLYVHPDVKATHFKMTGV